MTDGKRSLKPLPNKRGETFAGVHFVKCPHVPEGIQKHPKIGRIFHANDPIDPIVSEEWLIVERLSPPGAQIEAASDGLGNQDLVAKTPRGIRMLAESALIDNASIVSSVALASRPVPSIGV